jgi:hypothetical protein
MCGSDGVEFQIIPTKAEPDVSGTIPGRGRLTIPKKCCQTNSEPVSVCRHPSELMLNKVDATRLEQRRG